MATREVVTGSGIYVGYADGQDGYADNSDGVTQSLVRLGWRASGGRVLDRITASALAALSPTQGQVYIVTDGGDINKVHIRDNGAWFKITPFAGMIGYDEDIDEHIWFDGTTWQNGLPATVSGVALEDLVDVDVISTPPTTGDVLEWDGTFWVPAAPSGGGSLPSIAGGDAYKYLRVKSDESGYELAHLIEAHPYAITDETTDATTGTAKLTFRMPYAFHVTAVRLSANTAGTAIQVDINEGGASILSTKLTMDSGEKTSTTAATPPVISDASIADDAEMTIDIDSLTGSWKGLKVIIYGYRTFGIPTPPLTDTPYERWRILIAAGAGSTAGVDVSEIEMLFGGTDLTGGGSVVASSAYEGMPGSQAFDNNNSTRWASDFSNTWPQSIEYNFGAGNAVVLDGIAVNVATQWERGFGDFKIQYHDGVGWADKIRHIGLEADYTVGTFTRWGIPSVAALASPVVESCSSVKQNSDSTTIPLPKPSGLSDGDALVVAVGAGYNASDITAPDGTWTRHQLGKYERACGAIFTKPIASGSGSEPSSYTFTSNVSRQMIGAIWRVSGADLSDLVEASGKNGLGSNTTQHVAPPLSISGKGKLLIAGAFGGWGGAYTYTLPFDLTSDVAETHAAGDANGLTMAFGHKSLPYDYRVGSSRFVCSDGLHFAAFSLVLNPAP